MAHTEPSEKRGSGEEIHPLPSRSLSARFRRNSAFLQDVFPPFCYTSAYAEKGAKSLELSRTDGDVRPACGDGHHDQGDHRECRDEYGHLHAE